MKILNNISNGNLIILRDNDWLEKQRYAGKVVAQTLKLLKSYVINKTSLSMLELDKIAEDFIVSKNCKATFKNYKGFPNCCCISINQQLVHGIPTNYKLQEGDIVSFDLGATYEEVIADAAITCIYGNSNQKTKDLIYHTKNVLDEVIKIIKPGKQLGCIGNFIYNYATRHGLNVVTKYGGHGISKVNGIGSPHANPFVCNKAELNEGIRLQNGLTLAIEPLFTYGSTETKIEDDKWTVSTKDLNCHFEHTIFINNNYSEILTKE